MARIPSFLPSFLPSFFLLPSSSFLPSSFRPSALAFFGSRVLVVLPFRELTTADAATVVCYIAPELAKSAAHNTAVGSDATREPVKGALIIVATQGRQGRSSDPA